MILCAPGWLFNNGSAFLSGTSVVRFREFGVLRILFTMGWLFKNGSAFLSGTSGVRLHEFRALWILCTLGWLFKMYLLFFLVPQW